MMIIIMIIGSQMVRQPGSQMVRYSMHMIIVMACS